MLEITPVLYYIVREGWFCSLLFFFFKHQDSPSLILNEILHAYNMTSQYFKFSTIHPQYLLNCIQESKTQINAVYR